MLRPIIAFASALAAATVIVPTVSHATEPSSVRVSYADLDLASDPGRQILEHRIVRAARIVCIYDDGRDLDLTTETNACRTDAIASAQPAYTAAVNAARRGSVTVLDGAALIVTAP